MPRKILITLIIGIAVAVIGIVAFVATLDTRGRPAEEETTERNLFPFRRTEAPAPTNQETVPPPATEETAEAPILDGELPDLRQITIYPVAGLAGVSAARKTGDQLESAPAVRFVERATGHIWQVLADETEARRLSNTTIPKIQEAVFAGNYVVLRYLDDDNQTIQSFAGVLPKQTGASDSLELKGSFLSRDIYEITVDPDGRKVFYLTRFSDGAIGTSYEPSSGRKSQIFDSAFTEWASHWANSRKIILYTRPSANIDGYAYSLDQQTKSFDKILGGVKGLTAIGSPDGKTLLYSETRPGGRGFSLKVYELARRESFDLGLSTLPEKCVFAADGENVFCAVPRSVPDPGRGEGYPDAWYQGLISFSDGLWKINIKTGATELLVNPNISLDAVSLRLDPKEKYLFFLNKTDSTLWSLRI